MDRTDEVFEEIFEESESVSYTYGKVKLTWYETEKSKFDSYLDSSQALIFYSLQ
ncbi:hypothetical protein [Streptococcus pneumoniae]|uniref:hypothetical protein n=1 Tax=Streptococcus pneumoniae TaxID=1313 RepID=UPI0015C628C8|nr:hypothetical protein [Streptococcus pneumoniae]